MKRPKHILLCLDLSKDVSLVQTSSRTADTVERQPSTNVEAMKGMNKSLEIKMSKECSDLYNQTLTAIITKLLIIAEFPKMVSSRKTLLTILLENKSDCNNSSWRVAFISVKILKVLVKPDLT